MDRRLGWIGFFYCVALKNVIQPTHPPYGLTDAAQNQLDAKETKYPQTVNRCVSFNAMKNHAFDLLLGDVETAILEEKLTALFLTNPIHDRKHRNPPRKKSSSRRLLNFHKRQKKHCF